MIDELELPLENAEAIIEKAIEFGVYTDDMPTSKKDKQSTAHEIVAFSIDSWTSEGVTPDAKDKGTAEAGEQIAEIFEIAGVEIDEDGEITYSEPPEADGDNDGDGDDDEAAIDINDIIKGYEELTAATRLKKIKALELDAEDDDDAETLNAIADWEEAQDKPSSRVLDWLTDQLGEEVDGEAEGDDDGDSSDDAEDGEGEDEPYTEEELLEMDKSDLKEVAGEFELDFPTRLTDTGRKKVVAAILEAQEEDEGEEGDGDAEGDAAEEPWDGYEEASVKDIKEVLNDDERTVEELEYIGEYEAGREKPRKAITDLCAKRIEELSESDDDGEPEPEEKKSSGRRRGRRGKTSDPDDSDDVDNAVAEDDEKDAKKSKRKSGTITHEVAFKLGKSDIVVSTEGLFGALGIAADVLLGGDVTSVEITSKD